MKSLLLLQQTSCPVVMDQNTQIIKLKCMFWTKMRKLDIISSYLVSLRYISHWHAKKHNLRWSLSFWNLSCLQIEIKLGCIYNIHYIYSIYIHIVIVIWKWFNVNIHWWDISVFLCVFPVFKGCMSVKLCNILNASGCSCSSHLLQSLNPSYPIHDIILRSYSPALNWNEAYKELL